MNKSIYILLALILVVFLIAGFFYFQDKPENNVNSLNNSSESIWDNLNQEYFLDESIFDTDARTDLRELNIPGNEKLDKMFMRNWYNDKNISFMTVRVREYKDKIFDSKNNIQTKSGSTSKLSENATMTYLNSFAFQDEIINEYKIETKQEQDVKTIFYLKWIENKYSFSIKTISSEYQNDMREIAKNIIERYPI